MVGNSTVLIVLKVGRLSPWLASIPFHRSLLCTVQSRQGERLC
jgi:hypothetical protein